MHLRIGDILTKDKNNNIACMSGYCMSFDKIKKIIDKFYNKKKIYFVYGVHTNNMSPHARGNYKKYNSSILSKVIFR